MADTEGSTATGAPFYKKKKCTMCISVCPHTMGPETEESQKESGDRGMVI